MNTVSPNLIVKRRHRTIDKEISKLIEEQYLRAIEVLKKNKDKLTELAERLLEKEVIFKEDLEKIFGKRPFEKHFDKKGQEITVEKEDSKDKDKCRKKEKTRRTCQGQEINTLILFKKLVH